MADLPDHAVTRELTKKRPLEIKGLASLEMRHPETTRTNRHCYESPEPGTHLGDELGGGLVGGEMTAAHRRAVVAQIREPPPRSGR
jgi:hypothetical protein